MLNLLNLKCMITITVILFYRANAANVNYQTQQMDSRFYYQALVYAIDGTAGDSCGATLITYKYVLCSFMCVERIFRMFRNITVFAGFSGLNQGYSQQRVAVTYVINKQSMYSETAIVQVYRPFVAAWNCQLAQLPQPGQHICNEPKAVAMYTQTKNQLGKRTIIIGGIIGVIGVAAAAAAVAVAVATVVICVAVVAVLIYHHQKQRDRWMQERIVYMRWMQYYRFKYCQRRRLQGRFCWGGHWETQIRLPRPPKIPPQKWVGIVNQVPQHLCKPSMGWPLFCEKVVWGFQTTCRSAARGSQNEVDFRELESDVDFIKKTTGLEDGNSYLTHRKMAEKSIGASFTHGSPGGVLAQILLCLIVTRLLKMS